MTADQFVHAVIQRHVEPFRRSEFLKAVRALSARYVERRRQLPDRSALDSAGKRAAFAGFFAPLHFLTVQAIVEAVGAAMPPLRTILDLGCGTGAASAAWATAIAPPPTITGVDRHPWAVAETAWTWRTCGLRGRARQDDLVAAARQTLTRSRQDLTATGILCAWSVNELADRARATLLPILLDAARAGASILVVEPLAHAASPWWEAWADAFASVGGRSDAWRFEHPLPPILAELDEAAGFRREGLAARSLWRPLPRPTRPTA
jgi:hypothetical protein